MAEEKKDSFWDNKNDDFWNKPVVSEDWLKSDNDSFWKSSHVEEHATVDDIQGQYLWQSINTNQWQRHRDVKGIQDNPYVQYMTPEQVQDILEGKKPRKSKPAKSIQKQTKVKSGEKSGEKSGKKHIHTMICLCAMGIAVLSVVVSVISARQDEKSAIGTASKFHGTEEMAGSSIRLSECDVMSLEDKAYTVLSNIEDECYRDKLKVIAVYADIDYDADTYTYFSINNCALLPYIGYDTAYGREYREKGESWEIEEYGIESVGFTEAHYIYSYTMKGYASSGYYFFAVPMDVKEIDLYVETYSYEKNCRIVDKIYVKHMQIEEQPDLEELRSRKVVQ